MATRTVTFVSCGRCDVEAPALPNRADHLQKGGAALRLTLAEAGPEMSRHYDLCPKCLKLFQIFMGSGTAEGRHKLGVPPEAETIFEMARTVLDPEARKSALDMLLQMATKKLTDRRG